MTLMLLLPGEGISFMHGKSLTELYYFSPHNGPGSHQNQGYERQSEWQEPHNNRPRRGGRGGRGGRGRGLGGGGGGSNGGDWDDRRNHRDSGRPQEDEFGRTTRPANSTKVDPVATEVLVLLVQVMAVPEDTIRPRSLLKYVLVYLLACHSLLMWMA